MDLTPGPAEDQERSDEPKIPREALIEAAKALVATRDLTFNPNDREIQDALDSSDWCLECVGPDGAAMVAAQLVAAILWPLAYRAGREDWARGVVGYLYVGPDGREMLLDPADVTIVRSENQQPRTPEGDVTP